MWLPMMLSVQLIFLLLQAKTTLLAIAQDEELRDARLLLALPLCGLFHQVFNLGSAVVGLAQDVLGRGVDTGFAPAASLTANGTGRIALGYRLGRALSLVRGEVVLLADQDDVWEPRRRDALLAAFDADPRTMVAVSDASLIDGEGRRIADSFMATRGGFDGSLVGTAEQRLGSLEPSITAFENPELVAAASEFIASGSGGLPFDPTLGNAHKIAQTEETLWEHIKKGGPVMWPIFLLGFAALFVALFKWITMLLVKMPAEPKIRSVLRAVGQGDHATASRLASELPGPVGAMLVAGTSAHGQPRDAIEESMYETVQRTQHRLQSLLPFVAISASAAPLLGLLGTVTGIMNTFSLITIYGTGDVKTLSSGISEALITSEYGLIVAIPSLLLHAVLWSKVRKIVNNLEATGVSFVNELARAEARGSTVVEPKATSTKEPAVTA
jgi:biopolymer transport protein ExbB/TolQ